MHELSLMADLMHKIDTIAREQSARRVSRVAVTIGALAHISAEHFREHFERAARETICEGAYVDVTMSTNIHHPHAQDILLDSVELEVDDDA